MEAPMISYSPWPPSKEEALTLFEQFKQSMSSRRSVREFSTAAVSKEKIESMISLAASAPSGANKQPWHFVAVENPSIKKQIRASAEQEEKLFYQGRASDKWLKDLEPFGTNWQKPFLEDAPWLIIVFRKNFNVTESGEKAKNYYVQESVGIACGFLIAAIHLAGLSTLTHTPSPMGFLSEILGRPKNEKPFLLLPVGYPKKGTKVPDITKKEFNEITDFM
ncbi:MAG: nitroreductase family protein [Flavobacteriales bacterium]|jgi:nitroreductase|nr:nitroreductase family protein [Flavobacteriales bacterium]|tara:strand:- start:682 stop:1344 length:663 start_codon:yes stop_codon:yes gene_type:complete